MLRMFVTQWVSLSRSIPTRKMLIDCESTGGYGCMTACLDVDGLADCFIGYYEGKASEKILDTYAQVRRDIFLKYVDARSVKNLNRVWKSNPWTVLEEDKFFGIIQELNKDKQALKDFLLVSSNTFR